MLPTIMFAPDAATRRPRLEEIRRIIASPQGALVWARLRAAAERERDLPPYLVGSIFPGRDEAQARMLGMDWTLCRFVGLRLLRHALMFLVDEDPRWLTAALRQAEVLFDDVEYPAWNHMARLIDPDGSIQKGVDLRRHDVHLRTGMLAKDVSLMFNWLRPHLDTAQTESLVRGLERRAIRPFQQARAQQPWWLEVNNNWMTCIVSGLGICGMALDGLHPEARALIDYADPMMERHLEDFGAEGEFNEGLGYAVAMSFPVDYYAARLGWSGGRDNRLAAAPFPAIAKWFVYMTAPPGHLFAFGDGVAQADLKAEWMVTLAAAQQDPVLQDYARHHASTLDDPLPLLGYDPDLAPASADGRLPLGHAFREQGAIVSSRTSWDWRKTACVVAAKARREDNHEHNDPGEVVIYGEGRPLIVDWGTPKGTYPAGFFTHDRFRYFEASAFGHNVLVFGGRDLESCYVLHPKYTEGILHGKRALLAQGRIVDAEFDDHWGGRWQIDTTAAWADVKSNVRTVLHVLPGFIVVLDQARLERRESISLRWNTARRPAATHGDFALQFDDVGLAARVLNLAGGETTFHVANHGYTAPWNMSQFNTPLPERDCPYFETLTHGDRACLLSLFNVQPGSSAVSWHEEHGRHIGTVGDDRIEVRVEADAVRVHSPRLARSWALPLSET